MEDVEERRRRLAAMREAASQADDAALGSLPAASALGILSNPLEDSVNVAAAEDKGHGFGFYTDPLAGFLVSKRRKAGLGILSNPNEAPQSSNTNPQSRASIMHPPSHLQPPNPYPPPGASNWQPVEYQPHLAHPAFAQPYPPAQFVPQIPPPHYMNHHQWSNETSPYFLSQTSGPGRGQDRGFGGRYNGRHSPTGPAGRGDVSGRGYPRGAGRGNVWSGGSSSGDSWRNEGRSEGRGVHERGHRAGRIVSAKEQPHLFFKRSMLEHPWQGLQATNVETA